MSFLILISYKEFLNPIQARLFLAFYDRGGVDSTPPPENNVTVELGQWNLAQAFACQKTTPVPNLVAIA